MSPTAEQLIRDYLNRVSVAARTKLHSDDRRAFLARMRFSIERHCGPPDTADPVEVARVLANLGDPQKLVDAEWARLKGGSSNEVQAGASDASPQTQTSSGDAPAGRAARPGPQLASPQGAPQRRRRTPSPWLVSGTGLNPAPGAASGAARASMPLNPVLASRQPTGEIKVQSRPITSRWRPGETLQPRQPKPKQPKAKQPKAKQPLRLRVRRGGRAGDQITAGDSDAGAVKAGGSQSSEIQADGSQISGSQISGSQISGSQISGSQAGGSQAGGGLAAAQQAGDAGETGGVAESSARNAPPQLRAPRDVRGPVASAESGAASGLVQRPESGSPRELGASGAVGPGGPGLRSEPGDRPGSGGRPGDSEGTGAGDETRGGDGTWPGDQTDQTDQTGQTGQTGSVTGPGHDLDWIPGLGPAPGGSKAQTPELKPLRAALGPQLAAALTRVAQLAADLWRGHPMEGTAVTLLVLAGLVYPFPIWLVGFVLWTVGILLVLASKIWDNVDKAIGVAVPVIVALVGTLVALAVGGTHDSASAYAHEVGATGPPILRATVVLGGIYLAFRARRGPRSPNLPPWNRPHRI